MDIEKEYLKNQLKEHLKENEFDAALNIINRLKLDKVALVVYKEKDDCILKLYFNKNVFYKWKV